MFVQLSDLPVVVLLLAGVVFSIAAKKLTPLAAFTGFVCGFLIYRGGGYTGVLLLTVFFLCGTLATSWGRRQKQYLDRAGDEVQRKYTQVLANAGAATLLAVLSLIFPIYSLWFNLMLAASLASATADTLSSELGMLYGKNFYNCLSFRKEAKGLDGVISLEGTLLGMLGAVLIAALYTIGKGIDLRFLIIVFAATAGNFSDSLFGATFERQGKLNNDAVNFLSTVIAAGIALLCCIFFDL